MVSGSLVKFYNFIIMAQTKIRLGYLVTSDKNFPKERSRASYLTSLSFIYVTVMMMIPKFQGDCEN